MIYLERTAVYAGTRNLYHDMIVSAKSLLYHNGADHVYFLIEDDTFPEYIPDCISTLNVSHQSFFHEGNPNSKCMWTYMVMMRTALTKLFPQLNTILSLDHDTIVRQPIDLLWRINLGNDYYYAAVEEKQIDIRTHPYYNFGVVLHNLAKLRDGMDDSIIAMINSIYLRFCEQDAVNALCSDKILELPPAFNAVNFHKPAVPEEQVIIRHYASQKEKLRTFQDYIRFDNMPWDEVIAHKNIDPVMRHVHTRHDIINYFILKRHFTSFLEIGTDTGVSLYKVKAQTIVSVDPDPKTPATHHLSSDEFFATHSETYDVIFIDGLHECYQVYRDICNAMQHINPGGVVILHDCLPTSERMQSHSDHYPGGAWTGDVWKAFVKARTELKFELYTLDMDYGCGIIDTTLVRRNDTSRLPVNMDKMYYKDFVENKQYWMNIKEVIQNG